MHANKKWFSGFIAQSCSSFSKDDAILVEKRLFSFIKDYEMEGKPCIRSGIKNMIKFPIEIFTNKIPSSCITDMEMKTLKSALHEN